MMPGYFSSILSQQNRRPSAPLPTTVTTPRDPGRKRNTSVIGQQRLPLEMTDNDEGFSTGSSVHAHTTTDAVIPGGRTAVDAADYESEEEREEHHEVSSSCSASTANTDDRRMAFSAIVAGGGGRVQQSSSKLSLSPSEQELQDNCGGPGHKDNTPSNGGETVILNVGGQRFETYRSTLRRLRTCKLANDSEMIKYYRPEKGDYFFDRDGKAFTVILNYLRSGELHLPTYICGPALRSEFAFWGVDELDIERCCWQPYNTWKTQNKSLEKLEYDRKQSTTHTDLRKDLESTNCWKRCRATVWKFLQDPTSSKAAKVS
jgi:hypothetical protein